MSNGNRVWLEGLLRVGVPVMGQDALTALVVDALSKFSRLCTDSYSVPGAKRPPQDFCFQAAIAKFDQSVMRLPVLHFEFRTLKP